MASGLGRPSYLRPTFEGLGVEASGRSFRPIFEGLGGEAAGVPSAGL